MKVYYGLGQTNSIQSSEPNSIQSSERDSIQSSESDEIDSKQSSESDEINVEQRNTNCESNPEENRQAISEFFQNPSDRNLAENSLMTNNEPTLDTGRLPENSLGLNSGQMFDSFQANGNVLATNKESTFVLPQETHEIPSKENSEYILTINDVPMSWSDKVFVENSPVTNDQTSPDTRLPRSTNIGRRQHRSPSRENMQNRQDARNHEHGVGLRSEYRSGSLSNISHSLSSNYMVSDVEEQNLITSQLSINSIDSRSISSVDPPIIMVSSEPNELYYPLDTFPINPTIYNTSNNSSYTSSDLMDTNQLSSLTNSAMGPRTTMDLQTTTSFNSEHIKIDSNILQLNDNPNNSSMNPKRRLTKYTAACTPCKSRKIKCDGKSPCAKCIEHNRVNKCVFVKQLKRGPKKKSSTISKTEYQQWGEKLWRRLCNRQEVQKLFKVC
ncbi:10987_t:CDS:2 [Scutellospora calospora]|uniref:10987_t:CDS:1 n=1 Tax=Scutellospora calospora TaxID=85575 RepID=A0ACA9KSP9_9GLOM|nr:10987_t:CDS:2 [Scutellospora calospora]